MTRFSGVDLAGLPKPQVVQELAYEAELAALKLDYAERYPDFTADLESEPVIKLLETAAMAVLTSKARENQAARAVMPAFATGSDLDHVGARFRVERLLLDQGDEAATPPVLPTYEDDDAMRRRVRLAPEAFSVAGPLGGYIFNALSAGEAPERVSVTSPAPGTTLVLYEYDPVGLSAGVKDAGAEKTNPGEVTVAVMGWEGDGTPTQATLDAVTAHLSANHVRPMNDTVIVQPVQVLPYQVDATLEVREGPEQPLALAAATEALVEYVTARHSVGSRVTQSGLHEALTVGGVEKVRLNGWVDIDPGELQAAYCTDYTISIEIVEAPNG